MTIYPFVLRFGWFEITGYGIMMMVGFLTGGWLISLELRRRRLNADYSNDMILAALIGGVIGAKLWYVANSGDTHALFTRGGLVWYGGFVGGALAVTFNSWRLRVPFWTTADLAAPALAAAYGLGRIGCFIVNDDYGRPTTLPWAVRFPQGLPPSTAANMQHLFGIPIPPGLDPNTVLAVHPTQLYEATLMLGVFALLWRLRLTGKPLGWLFCVYLVCAGAERFLIEIVRAKDDRYFGILTLAQLVSIVLIALGVYGIAVARKRAPEVPGDYLSKVEVVGA
ncbi:MAG: prolipoprotein diacylglyceryl transferase [Gemmatimonadota bacterium]